MSGISSAIYNKQLENTNPQRWETILIYKFAPLERVLMYNPHLRARESFSAAAAQPQSLHHAM
jgi:hypothetical protein